MDLHLLRLQRGKIQIDLRNSDGGLQQRFASMFNTESDFNDCSALFGVAKEAVRKAVDDFEKSGNTNSIFSLDNFLAPSAQFTMYVRPLNAPISGAEAFSGLEIPEVVTRVLECEGFRDAQQPLIFWSDRASLCAVDLDVDPIHRYSPMRVASLLDTFRPTPFCSWITHGGGLRFLYHRQDDYTAEEIAAIAFLNFASSVPYRALELKTETRHPKFKRGDEICSDLRHQPQVFDRSVLTKWLKQYEVDDAETQGWLDNRGMVAGKRYPHSYCPISPSDSSHGDPVLVGDHGIHCFVCESRGIQVGATKPGFFPYGHLIGGASSSALYYALYNFTHWEHARHILEAKYHLRGPYAKLIYSAALKLMHRIGDPRISAVFTAGRDLIRLDKRWTTLNGDIYKESMGPILEGLPACNYVSPNGQLRVDREKVAKLSQPHDLTLLGYQHFVPIIGCRIFTHQLEPLNKDDITIVMQPPYLAPESKAKYRARYVEPGFRMNLDEAWKLIELVCPEVNRNAVYALIAAKGIVEGGISMPPMIYITGVTGAAKSSIVNLAATICGDVNSEVVWSSSTERVRQAIADSKSNGTFVTFNEILKEASRSSKSPVEAMDLLLNLTPNSISHILYVGPVRLGSLPVFVWTDTNIPEEVKQDAQLARRLTHFHMRGFVDWKTSLKTTGVGQVTNIRTFNEQLANACNAILSHVIDTYFDEPRTFEEICHDLGFEHLSKSAAAIEGEDLLQKFFRVVCEAPALTGSDAVRWKGRGWKAINTTDNIDEINTIWAQLSDLNIGGKATSSRRCEEKDWAKLIGIRMPVEFETRVHGAHRLAVRFISSERTRQKYIVNEELLNGKVQLEPRSVDDGDDRSGDSERGGPEAGRRDEVSRRPLDSFTIPRCDPAA